MDIREILRLVERVGLVALQTLEPDRAMRLIEEQAVQNDKKPYLVFPVVSQEEGVRFVVKNSVDGKNLFETPDPLELVSFLKKVVEEEGEHGNYYIAIYQPPEGDFFTGIEGTAFVSTLATELSDRFHHLLLVSSNPRPPEGFRRYFHFAKLNLPSEEERKFALLEFLAASLEVKWGRTFSQEELVEMLGEETFAKLIQLGKGLTLKEFTDAVALSIASEERGGKVGLKVNLRKMVEVKENLVRQNPALELFHPKDVDPLVGFERAVAIAEKAFEKGVQKGILLFGIPGIGKSLFAKNLAKRFDIPTVFFDLGKVFGQYVGESERKMDEALKTIDELGECIVVIDELDKALSGFGTGEGSGVTDRVFGKFHTWLQDRKSPSFVVATANDISHLPASLLRAGRWNATLFVDYYPTAQHYKQLLEVYTRKYNLPSELIDVDPLTLYRRKFSGAEIADLVEKSYLFDKPLSQILEEGWVVPLSEAEPKKIENYRKSASRYPSAHTQTQSRKENRPHRKLVL